MAKPSLLALGSALALTLLTACTIEFIDNDDPPLGPDIDGGAGQLDASHVCGNGIVDAGEACDDGNNLGGDGCAADCASTEACGNGIVDVGEACDDGNAIDNDGCHNNCTVGGTATCGDGVVDAGEDCDPGLPGTSTATCDADCTFRVCGDGFVNALANEQCDSGTGADTSTCDDDCTIPVCGDAHVNMPAGEDCDAVSLPTSFCDITCHGVTAGVCGNGVVDAGEQCDDGNSNNNDACRNNCTLPP